MTLKAHNKKIWRVVIVLIFCWSDTPFAKARDMFSLQDILDSEHDEQLPPEKGTEFTEEKLDKLGNFLSELILTPWPNGVGPLVYIERNPLQNVGEFKDFLQQNKDTTNNLDEEGERNEVKSKRARNYRKYPWKRQNTRYEPSYICAPKKEEVFQLLMALHGERNGNKGQYVDFCNRKRPATFVFTNLRFLG